MSMSAYHWIMYNNKPTIIMAVPFYPDSALLFGKYLGQLGSDIRQNLTITGDVLQLCVGSGTNMNPNKREQQLEQRTTCNRRIGYSKRDAALDLLKFSRKYCEFNRKRLL